MKREPFSYACVNPEWRDQTVVCIASGPSLTATDVDHCRGRARVIAIKDAVRLAPWADVLYGCGADTGQWWARNEDRVQAFKGRRFSLDPKAARWADVLKQGQDFGLSLDPSTLCTGRNSGYQAINLAVLYGAARILLLGYDMQRTNGATHFHGDHAWHPQMPFDRYLTAFETIVAPLKKAGVTVINCSRATALTVFQRMTIQEALS